MAQKLTPPKLNCQKSTNEYKTKKSTEKLTDGRGEGGGGESVTLVILIVSRVEPFTPRTYVQLASQKIQKKSCSA